MEISYTVATFIASADTGQPIAQGWDTVPQAGFTPTSEWTPNAPLWDNRAIRLPLGTPPGDYRLWALLYNRDGESGEIKRLPVSGDDVAGDDDIGVLPSHSPWSDRRNRPDRRQPDEIVHSGFPGFGYTPRFALPPTAGTLMAAEFSRCISIRTNHSSPIRFIISHVARHPIAALLLMVGAFCNAFLAGLFRRGWQRL